MVRSGVPAEATVGQPPPHSRDSAGDQQRIVPLRNAGRFNSSPPHLFLSATLTLLGRRLPSREWRRNVLSAALSGTCPISQLNRRTNGGIMRKAPQGVSGKIFENLAVSI